MMMCVTRVGDVCKRERERVMTARMLRLVRCVMP